MTEFVKIGEKIELDLQLEFKQAGKFIRVTLTNKFDQALSESPITLTELSNGRYFDNSVSKKAGTVSALFEVFDDAGFATPSDFEDSFERYMDPVFEVKNNKALKIAVKEDDKITAVVKETDKVIVKVQ